MHWHTLQDSHRVVEAPTSLLLLMPSKVEAVIWVAMLADHMQWDEPARRMHVHQVYALTVYLQHTINTVRQLCQFRFVCNFNMFSRDWLLPVTRKAW